MASDCALMLLLLMLPLWAMVFALTHIAGKLSRIERHIAEAKQNEVGTIPLGACTATSTPMRMPMSE